MKRTLLQERLEKLQQSKKEKELENQANPVNVCKVKPKRKKEQISNSSESDDYRKKKFYLNRALPKGEIDGLTPYEVLQKLKFSDPVKYEIELTKRKQYTKDYIKQQKQNNCESSTPSGSSDSPSRLCFNRAMKACLDPDDEKVRKRKLQKKKAMERYISKRKSQGKTLRVMTDKNEPQIHWYRKLKALQQTDPDQYAQIKAKIKLSTTVRYARIKAGLTEKDREDYRKYKEYSIKYRDEHRKQKGLLPLEPGQPGSEQRQRKQYNMSGKYKKGAIKISNTNNHALDTDPDSADEYQFEI